MWFAALANVNVGLITVIWAVNPFFMSVADYFIFRNGMRYYHWIGLMAIVFSTIILSIRPLFTKNEEYDLQKVKKNAVIPIWMAVLISFLTAICFTLKNITIRILTTP